jgi:hypothetical protein
MNYNEEVSNVYVNYNNYNKIINNWNSEIEILHEWCEILGMSRDKYEFIKPKSADECIIIEFKTNAGHLI